MGVICHIDNGLSRASQGFDVGQAVGPARSKRGYLSLDDTKWIDLISSIDSVSTEHHEF